MTKTTFVRGATCFLVTFALATILTSFFGSRVKSDTPVQSKAIRIPSMVSSIPSIPVIGTILDLNGPAPTAKLRLKNNSGKAIMAYTLESGNEKDVDGSSAVNLNNALAGADEEFVVDIHLGNFSTGEPIRFCAVVFADGSAEGEEATKTQLKKSVEENKLKFSRELSHF